MQQRQLTNAQIKRLSTSQLETLADNDDLPEEQHQFIMELIDKREMNDYFHASMFGSNGDDPEMAELYAEAF